MTKMLELAVKAVPQLHLAQVWVPCKQCANMINNLSCMERATFINVGNEIVNSCENMDFDMFDYLQASEFQNIQLEKGIARALMSSSTKFCCYKNLCDISISENPLTPYAQKTRLSLYFAFCLERMHSSNGIYIIGFFLQSNYEDACNDYLQLFLKIMGMELKSYKFALGGELGEEFALSQPNAIQYESIEWARDMEGYLKNYSESNFQNYLQTADCCCLRPSRKRQRGWVFCSPSREELSENDFNSNSSFASNPIERKIKNFMMKIASKCPSDSYGLVQFWAPKTGEDQCYLATSDKPYYIGYLYKGLAFFRKQCMKHHYFVDEGAEEELGPPGRVYRNGHPKITTNLHLYSTREFSLRNHSAHCRLREYKALPMFDSHEHKCVGVLEFVGFSDLTLAVIEKTLTVFSFPLFSNLLVL